MLCYRNVDCRYINTPQPITNMTDSKIYTRNETKKNVFIFIFMFILYIIHIGLYRYY